MGARGLRRTSPAGLSSAVRQDCSGFTHGSVFDLVPIAARPSPQARLRSFPFRCSITTVRPAVIVVETMYDNGWMSALD